MWSLFGDHIFLSNLQFNFQIIVHNHSSTRGDTRRVLGTLFAKRGARSMNAQVDAETQLQLHQVVFLFRNCSNIMQANCTSAYGFASLFVSND